MEICKNLEVVYQQGDEIVYELPSDKDKSNEIVRTVIEVLGKDFPELKITYFRLFQLNKNNNYYDYYVKSVIDPEKLEIFNYEFKKVPNTFIIQAIKFWFDEPINEKDLKFIHLGILATFSKSVFDIYDNVS